MKQPAIFTTYIWNFHLVMTVEIGIFYRLFKYLKLIPGIIFLISLPAICLSGEPVDTQSGSHNSTGTDKELKGEVPFITVRNKTGSAKANKYFGDERGSVRAGICELSRTPLNALKPIAELVPFYIPDNYVTLDNIRDVSMDDIWQNLDKGSNEQHPVLYTHGFYISFERGCKRARLFQDAVGLADRFVMFSWPSDGMILNYTQDESDLFWSVAPLSQTLIDMVEYFGAGHIDIVAHSLGTRGIFLALLEMAYSMSAENPLINQVVLIAPDIDAEIFKQYLPRVLPLVNNLTVYVSDNDGPLALSRIVHGHPRLGESGSHLGDLKGIEIIDISDIPVHYPSGHLYHLYNEFVINDLARILNHGETASQRSALKQTDKNYWRLQP